MQKTDIFVANLFLLPQSVFCMQKPCCFLFLFFTFLIMGQAAVAQDLEEQVIVISKEQKLELPEAARNLEKINVPPREQEITPQQYNFRDLKPGMNPVAIQPKARTMPEEPLDKLYGNYLRIGGGNYAHSYLEAIASQKRSKNTDYGLHLKHNAFGSGPVDNSGQSHNSLRAWGSQDRKKSIIGGQAYYQRERYNFYGYDQERFTDIDEDSIKQIFNQFGVALKLASNDDRSNLAYKTGLTYDYIGSELENSENSVGLNGMARYELSKDRHINADAELVYANFSDSANSIGRTLVQLTGTYELTFEKFKANLGGRVAVDNDTINSSGFHLYPVARVEYYLVPEKFTLLAGVDGRMQPRTYRSFVNENPFLVASPLLAHTNQKLNLYAGIAGTVTSGLTAKLKVASLQYENLPLYVNDFVDSSRFNVGYDTARVSVLESTLELAYQKSKVFQSGLSVTLSNYSMGAAEKPWHLPTFTAEIWGRYVHREKIGVGISIHHLSGIEALNPNTLEAEALDAITDVDLMLDYRFSKRISAFIEIDNILSQELPRYLYYPSRGLAVTGGVSFAF